MPILSLIVRVVQCARADAAAGDRGDTHARAARRTHASASPVAIAITSVSAIAAATRRTNGISSLHVIGSRVSVAALAADADRSHCARVVSIGAPATSASATSTSASVYVYRRRRHAAQSLAI